MSTKKRRQRPSTFVPVVGQNVELVSQQPDVFNAHPVSPLIVRDVIARNLPTWQFYVTIPAATVAPYSYIVRGEWTQRRGYRRQTITVYMKLQFDSNADLPSLTTLAPGRGQGIMHRTLYTAANYLALLIRCRLHNSTGRGLYAPATITK